MQIVTRRVDSRAGLEGLRIEDARVIELTGDCAIVHYKATGAREGQSDYMALTSSTFVRRDGVWRLAHHQQTPCPAP